jgi:bacterioferritin
MKGDAKVIELLNQALTSELTAINQYFIHAEICESHGYARLHQQIKRDSIDEMKHAEKLIERILFLDGHPNMSRYGEIRVGAKVEEILSNDMAAEKEAISAYNHAIRVCAEVGDHGSRDLFQELLEDEEGHLDWLETQLSLISEVGLANYLSRQMKEEGA